MYSHIIHMQLYTCTCRIHIDAMIKTSDTVFQKNIPLTLFERLRVRGSWRPNRTETYWPLTLMAISVSFPLSEATQPEAWGPTLLGAGFLYRISSPTGLVSKLTDFPSSPSYIIVQSPTQYLPLTGHRNVSLPLSLECHVCSSSSGNNCHVVHRSLTSGASVCECTVGF